MGTPETNPTCPDSQWLQKYVSGSMDEMRAAMIAAHLDNCSACQSQADDLASREDSLLQGLRQNCEPPPAEESAQIDRLIAVAQQFEPKNPEYSSASPLISNPEPTTAPRWEDLVQSLEDSGWVDLEQLQQAQAALQEHTSQTLVNELVKREILTPFQAEKCLQGKWSELIIGDYLILEPLGEGGMALVFKARHHPTGNFVCIKTLHSSAGNSRMHRQRFRREFQAIRAIQHPHVVVAHTTIEVRGDLFLVMDFIPGQDLAQHVATNGPMALDEALAILHQVAGALQYIHAQGIIHRDIKPHNLLLDTSGDIHILDLGLARFDSYLAPDADATTHVSITHSGIVMGSVDYLPPEQALDARQADARSDIYSLGCTFFFLVTGKVMFAGSTLVEKLVAHREQPAPPLGAPPAIEALVAKMVAKTPAERYSSMADVVAAIDSTRAGQILPVPTEVAADPDDKDSADSSVSDDVAHSELIIRPIQGHNHVASVPWRAFPSPREKPLTNPPRRYFLQALFWLGTLGAAVGVALITQRLIPQKYTRFHRAVVVLPASPVAHATYGALRAEFQKRNMQLIALTSRTEGVSTLPPSSEQFPIQSLRDSPLPACGTLFLLPNESSDSAAPPEFAERTQELITSALQESQILVTIGNAHPTVLEAIQSQGYQLHLARRVDEMQFFSTQPGQAPQIIHLPEINRADQFLNMSQQLLHDLTKPTG